MSWRIVSIDNPARLFCQKGQLVIEQGERQTTLPIEDIACLILGTREITMTAGALTVLAQKGAMVISCDETYHPNGVFLPFGQHSRTAGVVHEQLDLKATLVKKIWQEIVKQKITNQAYVLEGHNKQKAQKLKALARHVKSYDSTNQEAVGAKLYWTALFGNDFKRRQEHVINGALNYGYAVVRAAIARAVVGAGLIPALGIYHKNKLNSFNLVDDLIEPYRPFVDKLVYDLALEGEADLSREVRQKLIALLTHTIFIEDDCVTVLQGISLTVNGFVRTLRSQKQKDLVLPEFRKGRLL